MNMPVIYLCIFLACSVVTKGDRLAHETDLQRRHEKLISVQHIVTDRYGNHTLYIGAFLQKCNICQESVRAARFVILNEMQQKIDNLCSLMKGVHDRCISKAKVYQDKVIRALFPGGPQVICKTMKMC